MCSKEKVSFKCFNDFIDYYKKIYKDYKKYGDRVIEVEFGKKASDYEEQIKKSLESNFNPEEFKLVLGDIWDEFFVIRINSVNDLKEVPLQKKVYVYGEDKFRLNRDFLNKIVEYKNYRGITYAMDDKYIYIISTETETDSLMITDRIILERTLKD